MPVKGIAAFNRGVSGWLTRVLFDCYIVVYVLNEYFRYAFCETALKIETR